MFGSQDLSYHPASFLNFGYSGDLHLYAEYGSGHQAFVDTAPTAPKDYEIEFNYKNSGKLIVNGVAYANDVVIERGNNCNLYICADNLVWDATSYSCPERFSKTQVEGFVITIGEAVVRDFVPVIKNEETDIFRLAVNQHWISREGVVSGFDGNWRSTDKLPVKPGDVIKFGLVEHSAIGTVTAYDSSGAVVGYISGDDTSLELLEGTFIVPESATHITITGSRTDMSSAAPNQYAYLITKNIGMYDKVNAQFHANAGTGSFTGA